MGKLLAEERGIVLPVVAALIAIITLLGFTAVFMVESQTPMVRHYAGREDALYLAEEGINKYLWHFNKDAVFYLDADNYPVQEDNNAHTIYRPVREEDEGLNYRMEIEIPKEQVGSNYVPVSNRAVIRATAWAEGDPAIKRTVEVAIKKRTFTQHGMVNDTEMSENGERVYWVDGEKFYGPLHTNDTLFIEGKPTFYGPVTYKVGVDPSSKKSDSSIFRQGVSYAEVLAWPSNVDNLMRHAKIDGHYYNGRTCIMLRDDEYDVRYWDKDTGQWKYNGVPYQYNESNGRYTNLDTGAVYNSFSQFAANIPSLDLPANGVIYVNGNYGDSGDGGSTYGYKFDRDYGNVFVSGSLGDRLTIVAANDIFITGYDPTDWRDPRSYSITSTGGVRYHNISFQQVFQGGNWKETRVNGTGDDMLGLVANGKILILHYNWPSQNSSERYYWGGRNSSPLDMAPNNITIHGALFARDKYYGFEYPESGTGKDTITLVGSVTQRYRGIVGNTAGRGYVKEYSHDPRMLFEAPPHYVQPANIGWEIDGWRQSSNHIE